MPKRLGAETYWCRNVKGPKWFGTETSCYQNDNDQSRKNLGRNSDPIPKAKRWRRNCFGVMRHQFLVMALHNPQTVKSIHVLINYFRQIGKNLAACTNLEFPPLPNKYVNFILMRIDYMFPTSLAFRSVLVARNTINLLKKRI